MISYKNRSNADKCLFTFIWFIVSSFIALLIFILVGFTFDVLIPLFTGY